MTEAEYSDLAKSLDRFLRVLLLELEFFIDDLPGIEVHSVHKRIKTFESATNKSNKLGIPIHKLHDISGIRIVTATQDDARAVVRFFTFKIDTKRLKLIKDNFLERPDGYRARHLILAEMISYSKGPFLEVQIVSLIENAFNHISRTWSYKASLELPDDWQTEFRSVATDLAKIDERIQKLHEVVVTSAVQQAGPSPITPFTYQLLTKEVFDEEVALVDAVDAVRMLGGVGIKTNEQLRNSLMDPRYEALRQEFVEYEDARWGGEGIGHAGPYSFYSFAVFRFNATKAYLQKMREHDRAIQRNPDNTNGTYVALLQEFLEAFGPKA